MAAVRIPPLACHGLGLQLAGNTVLSDIDLRVVAGETLGIVGPNGSGKSSLLKLLAGLRKPACGSVQLLGEPLAQMPRRRVAQALALVEQQADTLDAISVFDAVALGRTPWLSALAPFSRQDCAIVEQALADLDALHLRTRLWGRCPVASASVCTSPVRWPNGRRCCCWTNRPTTWTFSIS